ncbi:MAG: class I SAM-dependent methyltransferase [Parcubacteria group bacterium]
MLNPKILITHPSVDYALLDSGEGEKLERYGKIILSRPDPQALWRKNLPEKEWQKAGAIFSRDGKSTEWKMAASTPKRWQIDFADLKFWIKPTAFKHTGLFPEQKSNWEWIKKTIKNHKGANKPNVLNLFGYTGGASLAAAAAGAEVCHLDGSKTAISWAKENAEISGLKEKPIRWILDDATAFVKREIKRGRRYDGVIMDPPAFGHGPNNEMWKIEKDFLMLLDLCKQVLSENPLFFLINGYASGYSPIAYANNLEFLTEKFKGEIECGELTIAEEKSGRLLPCGIFARWNNA